MAHDYDAFLSHAPADRAVVEPIAARLRDEHGLQVCLEAAPDAVDVAIDRSRTVVILVGPNGMGPWQAEVYAYAVTQERWIIPVLLPGADEQDIPKLLRSRARADLAREGDFQRLVAGIQGASRRPTPHEPAPATTGADEVKNTPKPEPAPASGVGPWARLRRWLGRS